MKQTFVPRPNCNVSSGDCFRLGSCIGRCKAGKSIETKITLHRKTRELKQP